MKRFQGSWFGLFIWASCVLFTLGASSSFATEIVAHRGLSKEAPENTMAAFEGAWGVGADAMELDVHVTSDGQIVAIHDFTLERTTDCTGLVRDISYSDLATCDAGSWYSEEFANERVPLLSEVFERFGSEEIRFFIELKAAGTEEGVMDLIAAYGLEEQAVIISFNPLLLRNIQNLNPAGDIPVYWLLAVSTRRWITAAAEDYDFDGVGLNHDFTVQSLVDLAQDELGLHVNVWTVNSDEDIARVEAMGVDSLTTDKPLAAM